MNNLGESLNQLTAKKQRLDAAQPLSPASLDKLREALDVEWTYHSNAIEGNTLTLRETALVLKDGLTVGGKTLREHLEAINHQYAIRFVEEMAAQDTPVTEHTIRSLHASILRTISDEEAGRYRRAQVRITGSDFVPPEAVAVPGLMADLGAWLNNVEAAKRHPVERAALAHFRLVDVHPFVDGNGRTARLLMNLLLMRAGYPPAVLRIDDRPTYYDTLDTAHAGDTKPFVHLIAQAVDRSLETWLAAVES
jgi:Fic family protein